MHDGAALLEPTSSYYPGPSEMKLPMKPSDRLADILNDGDEFFHSGQQTNRMLRDHNRRLRLSHENHRKTLVPLFLEHASPLSTSHLLAQKVNPLDVTLTMQLSSGDSSSSFNRRLHPMRELFNSLNHSSDNFPAIMRDTNTIICFPDRGEEGIIASQVSIRGSLKNVEKARARVRDLTTVSISFPTELQDCETLQDIASFLDEHRKELPISLKCEVVPSQQKQIFDKPTVKVSGPFSEEKNIISAVCHLRSVFYPSDVAAQVLLIAELTVPSSQMEMFLGGERAEQLIAISRSADVFLHFIPQQSTCPQFTEYQNFIITGNSGEGVMHALKIMTALQPVQLSFNVLDSDLMCNVERNQTKKIFDEKSLVHTCITPSIKQFAVLPTEPIIHFVCMTAQEYNVGNIYDGLRSFFHDDLRIDRRLPTYSMPNFMAPVVQQLQVTPRYLDIQNGEFPEMILYRVSEKGDVLLLEKSVDLDESEKVYVHDVPHGDSLLCGAPDPFFVAQQDVYGQYFNDHNGSCYSREVSTRSYVEDRYDHGGYDGHRYLRGGYRGRRMNGSFPGRGRGGRFVRDREFRDRDFSGRNDFPRGRDRANYDDRPERPDKSDRQNRDGDESRRYLPRFNKPYTRNKLDDASLEGYMKYFINPSKSSSDTWRGSQQQGKTLLMKRDHHTSHNSMLEDDREQGKKIASKDLSIEENASYQSDGSRISYARMVATHKTDDQKRDSAQSRSEESIKERPRRRSASSGSSAVSIANYNHDSPFANGARQLEQRIDVEHVLFSINCDKYGENFRNIRNLREFSRLEKKDLLRMGVSSELDRNTIMEYIHKMRLSQARAAAPSRSVPTAL